MSDDHTPESNDSGEPPRPPRDGGRPSDARPDGSAPDNIRDEIRRQLDRPSDDVLREPAGRAGVPRGRTQRLTVAELLRQMEQSGQSPSGSAASGTAPSASASTPTPPPPRPSTPRPAPPTDIDDDATQTIAPVPADPEPSDTTRASGHRRRRNAGPSVLPPSDARLAEAGRRQRRKHTATTVGRVFIAVACVMALIGTGSAWGYLRLTNGDFRQVDATRPDDVNIRQKDKQYGDQTYLIVGTDTRVGKNGKVGAGTTADAEGARSDTVILVNVPANRSRVVAVSFPRDLQIDRPECKGWDNNTGTYTSDVVPAETGAKLNTAYGDGGPACAVEVIQQLSGLNINHFIAMDFYGFEQVVNKLGGVQVCSPTPLYDYELGQILSKAGSQKVTGKRALNYVRARTVDTEGNGDYGRIKRQQLFLSSLLRGMLSSQVLTNPLKLNGIIKTFIGNSFVDQVTTEDLVNLGQSLQGLQAGRVTFLTTPTSGTTTDGSNNEIPRTDDINAIFDAIINDEQLPGEQKAAAPSSSRPSSSSSSSSATTSTTPAAPTQITANATTPGNIGVRVLNGTGTAGLASTVSDRMSQLGFDVRGVADASENQTATVVRYGPGQQAAAATVASMITGAVIQPDRTVKSGVEVLLGSDYPGELKPVPDAGTRLTVTENPQSSEAVDLPSDLSVTNGADTSCSG